MNKEKKKYMVIVESASTERFGGGELKYYTLSEKLEWYLNNYDVSNYQIIQHNNGTTYAYITIVEDNAKNTG